MECSEHGELDLWKRDVGRHPIYTMTDLRATIQFPSSCQWQLSHMKSDKVATISEFKRRLHSKMRRRYFSDRLFSNLLQSVQACRYLFVLNDGVESVSARASEARRIERTNCFRYACIESWPCDTPSTRARAVACCRDSRC